MLVTLAFVVWSGYLLATHKTNAPLAKPAAKEAPGPVFLEIDLRGPGYELGRYHGYQEGRQSSLQGYTMPASQVLTFRAGEKALAEKQDATQREDFVTGYESGFRQALAGENIPAGPSAAPGK